MKRNGGRGVCVLAGLAVVVVAWLGLVDFLERAWGEYQVRHPGTHDVVPDVFAMPGLLDGIGSFPTTPNPGLPRLSYRSSTSVGAQR